MADITWNQANAHNANPNPNDSSLVIVDEARKVLCRRTVDFTKWFIPNALDPAYEAIVGQACPAPSFPSPGAPARPFDGGQCLVPYRIDGSFTAAPAGADQGGNKTFSAGTGGTIRGAIRNINVQDNHPLAPNLRAVICSANNSGGVPSDFVVGTIGSVGRQYSNFTVRVTRLDGQPDNCGSLPSNYPDVPRPGSPQLQVNVPVQIRPGVNVTVPIVPIIPVVKGELNVDFGGLNVKFDLGGITIGGGGGASVPSDLIERLNRIEAAADEAEAKAAEAAKNTRRKRPPGADTDLEATNSPPTGSGDVEVGEGLRWVCVNLTKLPHKLQQGISAPNCYFAGWLEFKASGCLFPREQINFEDSLFQAPEGATGFAFTLTHGAEGFVTIYTQKPEV